jgi:UDP-N-acetylmuramoyl-L-alanyl-D-glutamate--2,6-diaminopimelate ligase
VTVDDDWGRQLAATADVPVTTLAQQSTQTLTGTWHHYCPRARHRVRTQACRRTQPARPHGPAGRLQRGQRGSGHHHGAGVGSGRQKTLQAALDAHDPFTVAVPGRMQLVSSEPASVVDFAHNPDALARALEAVRSPQEGSRVIVVFGRRASATKASGPPWEPLLRALADVVIISDDDPHDEDAASDP